MLHIYRKKTLLKIVVACAILCSNLLSPITTNAQAFGGKELFMPDHDAMPYYFGITVGSNLARFHTDLHPRFLETDSVSVAEPTNSGGITLGLQATARLSDRFQLRFNPQLMFIERNIQYKLKYPDVDNSLDPIKKVESVIMSFPLQLKFQSDRIGNFRVYTLAGIKADIDMASNARAKKADELIKIQKYDWGPEFGIGFNFFFESFIFSPEIKISNGIRNIHARDENLRFSSVFDRIQSRMIVISLHLEG
jgi:Outer membrane protein beta-barrel domain